MKRIYFLAPNIDSTTAIVQEIKTENVPEKNIHIVGKDHHKLEEAHLHEANLLQTSDLIPSIEKGALAGGAIGLLAGLAAVTFPPAGLVIGGGAVLALSAFGSGFGAWVSSMIGISIPNPTVEKFEEAIKAGEILLIIDIPKVQEEDIKQKIKQHHPEALIEGVDIAKE
jgi:hypothetical protein